MRQFCIRKFALLLGALLLALMSRAAFGGSITLKSVPGEATANSVWMFEAVWTDEDGQWPAPVKTVKDADKDKACVYTDLKNHGMIMLYGVGNASGSMPNVPGNSIPMYYVKGDPGSGATYRAYVSAGLNLENWHQQAWGINPKAPADMTGIADDMLHLYYAGVLPKDFNILDPLTTIPKRDTHNNMIWTPDEATGDPGIEPKRIPMFYADGLRAFSGDGSAWTVINIYADAYKLPPAPAEGETPADATEVKSDKISVVVHDSQNSSELGFGGIKGDRDSLSCYPADNWPAGVDVDPLTVDPALDANATTPDDGSGNHQFVFRVKYHNADNLPPLPWSNNMYGSFGGSGVVLYLDAAGTGDYRAYQMLPEDPDAARLHPDDQVYVARFLPTNGLVVSPEVKEPSLYLPYFYKMQDYSFSPYVSLACGTYHYFFGCSDDYLRFGDQKSYALSCQPNPLEWGMTTDSVDETDNNALDPRASRKVTYGTLNEAGTAGTDLYSDIDRIEHRRYNSIGVISPFDGTIFVDRPVVVPGLYSGSEHPYPYVSNAHPVVTCELTMPAVDDMWVPFDDTKYGFGRFNGTLQPYKRAVNPQLPGAFTTSALANRAESAGTTTGTENVFRIFYQQMSGQAPIYVRLMVNNASQKSGTATAYAYSSYTMYPDPDQTMPLNYKGGVWYIYKLKFATPGPHTYYFVANDGSQKALWPRRPDHYSYDSHDYYDWWVPTTSNPEERGTATYDDNDYVPGPYVNNPCVLSDSSVSPTNGKLGQSYRYRVKYSDADGQRPNSAYLYIQIGTGGKIIKCQMLPEIELDPTANNSALYKSGVYYYFDTASIQGETLTPGTWRYRFEFTDDWGRQTDTNDMIPGELTRLPSTVNTWIDGPTVTNNNAPTLTNGSVASQDGTANSASLWTFKVNYSDLDNDSPSVIKVYIGQLQPDGKTVLWDEGHTMLQSNSNDHIYSDGAEFYYQTRLSGKETNDESDKQYYYSIMAYDGAAWAKYDANNSNASGVVLEQDLTGSGVDYSVVPPVAGSIIVGPLPVDLPVPPGIIQDARIYSWASGATSGSLLQLDDLKSGWQDGVEERYSVMKGSAVSDDRLASTDYVTPDDTSLIASVEGVYLTPDLSGTNYYNPALLDDAGASTLTDMAATLDFADQLRMTVIPNEPTKMASVIGVYDNPDGSGKNYIEGDATASPARPNGAGFIDNGEILLGTPMPADAKPYIIYRRTGYISGDSTIWLTTPLDADKAGSRIYIKYSDIRFTHQMRGWAITGHENPADPSISDANDPLVSKYRPSVNTLKGNITDIYGGVIGVWDNSDLQGENYFDPRHNGLQYNDGFDLLDLSRLVPEGTYYLWARYYQKGDYDIDRWNGTVKFLQAPAEGTSFKVTYLFGRPMPVAIGADTAPILINAKISQPYGARSTQFTFTVTYQDLDGPNGQAPSYVRLCVDGQTYDMTPQSTGTPAYRDGAIYTYTLSGLSGGEHKYFFQASDGVLLAWLDNSGLHQSDNLDNSSVDPFKGPWVNNPPELSSGAICDKNGQTITGTVTTRDSVDYFVTYKDVDNDAPYFYDASRDSEGSDVSGSPRLWVDSDAYDNFYTGTVTGLASDPLEPSKYRTITANNDLGASPNWTPDQFAGDLVQIASGSLEGRVYLIQTNTENTLILATTDLGASGDNLQVGSKFRINGLLMYKADPSQQDYTAGVRYKLSIPKLAVGSHKFHFTARSREDKPAWLIDRLTSDNQSTYPYSSEVRYPSSGEMSGPSVISSPPTGNKAPVISGLNDGPLYRGEKVPPLIGIQTDTNTVGPQVSGAFSQIQQVLGVYINANLSGTNYYSSTHPFKSGDMSITLTTPLPAVDGSEEFVQLASVDQTRLAVVPDKMDAIGSIVGVYDNANLTGTNYYEGAADVPDDDVISLRTDELLPMDVQRVYIAYSPSLDADYPVYIDYYGTFTSSTVFVSGEPLTFKVNYRDDDNDTPNYHDGVQGYLRVVFNDTTLSSQLMPVTIPVASYTVDTPFTVTLTNVSEGVHKYHFEASDGYQTTRFPVGTVGNVTANDYSIIVNYKPVLKSGTVDHTSGANDFTFSVTYQDKDAVAPPSGAVKLRLVKQDDPTIGGVFTMAVDPSVTSPNYATGVKFTTTVSAEESLEPGKYSIYFEASDAYQAAVPYTGTDITVRATNVPPQILGYSVTPTAGKTSATFTFSAFYYDVEDDAPVVIDNGQKKSGLTLILDRGTASEKRLFMSMVPLPVPDPPALPLTPHWNVEGGLEYRVAVTGKNIGAGNHTYTVVASDGTDDSIFADGVVSVKSGPVLMVPYFDLDVVAKDGSAINDATVVGQDVLIQGKMYFPYNTETSAPSGISGIELNIAKPDGSVLTLQGNVSSTTVDNVGAPTCWIGNITCDYSGYVDPALATGSALTLTGSGTWRISAVWAGDSTWDRAETDTNSDGINDVVAVDVSGPSRTVAVADPTNPATSTPVVDMITPPMVIGSSDPGAIFGHERALQMQIIRWSPTASAYFRYGVGGLFPGLESGEAVWIKPKTTYPAAESLDLDGVDAGWICLDNEEVARAIEGSEPRYYHTQYRLVKSYSQAYTIETDDSGSAVLDSVTKLPKLKTCLVSLKPGWNQVGNIFFNWQRDVQQGTPVTAEGGATLSRVVPSDTTIISRVLGVYLTSAMTGINYYVPGTASPMYARGDDQIALTTPLPAGTTTVYVKYEAYPKVDVGIPMSELHVKYLNQTKTLAQARLAGWVNDLAWRYDSKLGQYVKVHATASGAERVLNAWDGYWFRSFVDCQLVIDPNTNYSGSDASAQSMSVESNDYTEMDLDVPPPAPLN